MKHMAKGWLAMAVTLILLGVIAFGCALAAKGWDFSALSTDRYETREYEITENFRSIAIDSDTENIRFVPSEDGKCRAVFYESEKKEHTACVQDGILTIEGKDTRKWYEFIALFSFGSPRITVYLPAGEYASLRIEESTGDIMLPGDFAFESVNISVSTGDIDCNASASGPISIKTSTGDIRLESIAAGQLDLSVTTGKVEVLSAACAGDMSVKVSTGKTILEDVTCLNLTSRGSTGSITMKNVIAKEMINVERSTGDVKMEMCDANELNIKTDTGDVSGTLLTEKIFVARSDTGRIRVPETTGGGRCAITTDTGSIRMEIKQ